MAKETHTLETFWRMMNQGMRLREVMDKQIAPFCSANGITPKGLYVLVSLHYSGPQGVSALAQSTCMADTNNSALCKKMEADGLLKRRRASQDERRVVVSLAPKGQQLVETFLNKWAQSPEICVLTNEPERLDAVCNHIDALLAVLETEGEIA